MDNKPRMPSGRGRGRAYLLGKLLRAQPGRVIEESSAPTSEPVQAGLEAVARSVEDGSSEETRSGSASLRTKADSGYELHTGLQEDAKPVEDNCSTEAGSGATHSKAGSVHESVTGSQEQLQKVTAELTLGPSCPVDVVKTSEEVVKYRGTSGEIHNILCNYIRLNIEPNRGVFEYEVKYVPDIDNKGLCIDLLNQHLKELGGVKTFDGFTLYLPIHVPNKEFISINPLNESKVKVSIIFKYKKRFGECIHLYNVLLKRMMGCLDLVRFKRHHFDPSAPKIIPQHQLEVWPGYVMAVDEFEDGVMLCLDASHRVLRQKTALDHLRELVRGGDQVNIRDNAAKSLIGCCVLTRYNNRSYIIDDIAFDMCPTSTFENSRGESLTFLEYYKRQYGIDIFDLKQPLLISHSKVRLSRQADPVENSLCLVPELAFLTGLTEANRKDFRLMKDLATYTRITPNQRIYSLRKFISSVNNNQKCCELLSSWGLSLEQDLIKVTGRTLMPEEIRFGGEKSTMASKTADWNRESTNNQVIDAVDITNWAILHTNRDFRYAQDFKNCIMRIAAPMGITITMPIVLSLPDDRVRTFVDATKKIMKDHPDLKLITFIFPTIRDDRYASVKKLCCVDYGIASQVINSKTIARPDRIRSIVQKIALQINCKLGGSLWAVPIPLKNCMICGLDTYHDPTRRGKSVYGFVTTLNQTCTKYFSQVGFQDPHEEMAMSLQSSFRAALKRFFDYNGAFPKRIIFYRDGISAGQMNFCRQVEVGMMEECFNNSAFEIKPLLTFITVQKKINTRLMALTEKEYSNPGPGTIVDQTITRRNMYDFFLVPQNVQQGTVSPTHYVVLRDTAEMKPDHVQRLSYKMCHLYYNWAGTIRVPACCQYAHKLAYLIGEHVKERPHPSLMDRLYYL